MLNPSYEKSRSKPSGPSGPAQATASPKLLDQVRRVMRLHHYSIHTERSYIDWIRRFIRFHRMHCREDLAGGEAKIEAF
jgi:hypothetical protein